MVLKNDKTADTTKNQWQ